MIDSNTFTWL